MDTLKQTSDVIRDHQLYFSNYPRSFSGQNLVQWFTNREGHDNKDSVSTIIICMVIF